MGLIEEFKNNDQFYKIIKECLDYISKLQPGSMSSTYTISFPKKDNLIKSRIENAREIIKGNPSILQDWNGTGKDFVWEYLKTTISNFTEYDKLLASAAFLEELGDLGLELNHKNSENHTLLNDLALDLPKKRNNRKIIPIFIYAGANPEIKGEISAEQLPNIPAFLLKNQSLDFVFDEMKKQMPENATLIKYTKRSCDTFMAYRNLTKNILKTEQQFICDRITKLLSLDHVINSEEHTVDPDEIFEKLFSTSKPNGTNEPPNENNKPKRKK